ncbi:velvet factor-domain-containing protein [Polychytrium aggregatum]|uniref:velvet factor-domain-containing protein n=1 Tax=Polychytrium aggregatum TaxID=110093 RepID=UPI0022FE520E|nr:velvet factor-domain-containing protein [Polychytrium aggregatum]KAI9204607.1 velvet factor-domain-containing protein [Polychytrium aggregatum]
MPPRLARPICPSQTPPCLLVHSPHDLGESVKFIAHVKLWSLDGDVDHSLVPRPKSTKRGSASDTSSGIHPTSSSVAVTIGPPAAPPEAEGHSSSSSLAPSTASGLGPERPAQPSTTEPSQEQRSVPLHLAMFGTLVSQAYFLSDMSDEQGVFFIFDQVCVRIEGRFRLKFVLNDLDQSEIVNTGGAYSLASVKSEPFIAYGWKQFPGMQLTTPLTLRFANQGTGLHVRQVIRQSVVSDVHDDSPSVQGKDDDVD